MGFGAICWSAAQFWQKLMCSIRPSKSTPREHADTSNWPYPEAAVSWLELTLRGRNAAYNPKL
eukprot:5937114-Pyramimonas_sp.AAC.1